jgi:membrane-bound lytic murein transglycosylase D
MSANFLLKLLPLLFVLPQITFADTNVVGDEITVLSDSQADATPKLGFSPNLQNDSTTSYLPDTSVYTSDSAVPISADLWQRIINGYDMPEVDSDLTAKHESWYAARPEYVRRMVDRSQKYLYHIVGEVEKRGMPTEIALLPMVESAYNPQAYSTSHASGIWQFIPSTGKDFGLKQNWWVDSRRNVTAATDAALNYLQRLHVMFGTWDLALAAYNAGEGTVSRAIESNRRKGLPTDYESLPLPPETRNYVPKLQAIKNIMTHPEEFGLSIQTIANQPYFIKVSAPQQIDAHLAATLAGISFDEFSSLNPQYNRPVITANSSDHEILLPVTAADTFKVNLANYTKPLVSWQTYHAKRGERMDNIARKFGINLSQLRDVNDLPAKDKMRSAMPLLVPMGTAQTGISISSTDSANQYGQTQAADESKTENSRNLKHTVKPKETLQSIANLYGMTSKQLMANNQLKTTKLKPGQILSVIKTNTSPNQKLAKNTQKTNANASKKIQYVVKRGDTLESIAKKFDVARDEIQRWNKISGSRIAPGEKLTINRPDEA